MIDIILAAWQRACAFVDGPDGNLVIAGLGVGVALILLRFDPRLRGFRRSS